MRPCFAFNNSASADTPAVLSIYDEIGFWGVQAKDFVNELRAVKSKVLNVEINSPGGDVFAGLAIYNALKSSGKEIVVTVMGVAASAASLIAMAGDRIVMPKNTFMMIHNPWSFAMGNADELRETADTLDKIGGSLLATYASKTGMEESKLAEMLAKDTWLSADEALEMGFATEVVDDVKANAKFDMARADLPEAVRAVFAMAAAPKVEPEPAPVVEPQATFGDQVLSLSKAAGMEDYASIWALRHTEVGQVEASITAAREIKSLCATVNMADRAPAFIRGGKSLDDVRAALIEARAKTDEDTHVDTTPKGSTQPTTLASAKSALTPSQIWQKRNSRK